MGSKGLTLSGAVGELMCSPGLTAFLQAPKVISPCDRTAF